MYILKKIFKNKNKPFFGQIANDTYDKMYFLEKNDLKENEKTSIIGIVQEISDGGATVVTKVSNDNSYQHIRKDGKITDFIITKKSLLKSKKKIFDLCNDNIQLIKEYSIEEKYFLKERGVRMTFLTSNGIYSFKGQLIDFNKGLFLPHISCLFGNILLSFDRHAQKTTRKFAQQVRTKTVTNK